MLTFGSLCTGAGGLDLAASAVLGEHRLAWVAETDADASRVLAARFGAPNLGDITATDWRRVEPVDVLTAGFPCQDISAAGRRAGIEGAKSGVWRNVAEAIGVLRPRLVLLENVAALLIRGGTRVVADLAALGYVGSWRTLRASDIGAPHRRERFFLVAVPHADREPQRGSSGDLTLTSSVMLLPTPRATDCLGGQRIRPETVNDRGRVVRATGVSHGLSLGEAVHLDRWAQYGPAIARWEQVLGRSAPEPTVIGKRGGRRLSGRFTEWLIGWPDGWVTDLVDNTSALRICGNGVVPQQGAAAYRTLLGVGAPTIHRPTSQNHHPDRDHLPAQLATAREAR